MSLLEYYEKQCKFYKLKNPHNSNNYNISTFSSNNSLAQSSNNSLSQTSNNNLAQLSNSFDNNLDNNLDNNFDNNFDNNNLNILEIRNNRASLKFKKRDELYIKNNTIIY